MEIGERERAKTLEVSVGSGGSGTARKWHVPMALKSRVHEHVANHATFERGLAKPSKVP